MMNNIILNSSEGFVSLKNKNPYNSRRKYVSVPKDCLCTYNGQNDHYKNQ